MTKSLSLYLNLMRALAAVAVYLFHAQHFSKIRFPVVGNLGNEAVIVFFVLSGLLITGSAFRQPSFPAFVQARLARLWSVAIPALLLTMAADLVGQCISLASYQPMMPYSPFKWIAAIGINSMFLNQIWNLNIYPGTNGVFWSLSYEFWYYMIFAAFFYFRRMMQLFSVALALLVAGPSILGGLPVWLLGTLAFLGIRRIDASSSRRLGNWLWYGSLAALVTWQCADLATMFASAFPYIAENAKWPVNFWPTSYLIGALTAANIYGFALIGQRFEAMLVKASPVISFGADISFGLYLFHYPLMYLSKAICNASGLAHGGLFVAVIYIVPFAVSALLAIYFERHKDAAAKFISLVVAKAASYRSAAQTDRFIDSLVDDLEDPAAAEGPHNIASTKY